MCEILFFIMYVLLPNSLFFMNPLYEHSYQRSRQFACFFYALKSAFFAIHFCLSGLSGYTTAHGLSR